LEVPAEGAAIDTPAQGAVAVPLPAAIGRYRIMGLLGQGGMGAVYEAEQDQPRRTVALKVIKPGLATAETLRRFRYESQALGRLQHPGIAQIHEAGTADSGFGPQPYFAMELIRGRALHEYADGRQLKVRERLALMAKVCDAVDHAHRRGVIHRDLKPGNILVDETGEPKILDFGVARVTDSDVRQTRQTDLGQLVGTLAYMSPSLLFWGFLRAAPEIRKQSECLNRNGYYRQRCARKCDCHSPCHSEGWLIYPISRIKEIGNEQRTPTSDQQNWNPPSACRMRKN
jgi:eukaryotic-like serine/threonine-protein kinase